MSNLSPPTKSIYINPYILKRDKKTIISEYNLILTEKNEANVIHNKISILKNEN